MSLAKREVYCAPFLERTPLDECASVYHARKSSKDTVFDRLASIALNAELSSESVSGSPRTMWSWPSCSLSISPSPLSSNALNA